MCRSASRCPATNSGWTAGIGIEWAFAGTWSARAEYDYIGLTKPDLDVCNHAINGDQH